MWVWVVYVMMTSASGDSAGESWHGIHQGHMHAWMDGCWYLATCQSSYKCMSHALHFQLHMRSYNYFPPQVRSGQARPALPIKLPLPSPSSLIIIPPTLGKSKQTHCFLLRGSLSCGIHEGWLTADSRGDFLCQLFEVFGRWP